MGGTDGKLSAKERKQQLKSQESSSKCSSTQSSPSDVGVPDHEDDDRTDSLDDNDVDDTNYEPVVNQKPTPDKFIPSTTRLSTRS